MFGDGQQGIKIPEKLEPRTIAMILFLIIIAVLAVLADQVVFERPAGNFFERVLAIPATLAYPFVQNRWLASGVAAGVIAVVVGGIGGGVWFFVERRILEPMHIKRVVQISAREEKLWNQYKEKE